MAITLNKQAAKCEEIALAGGKITHMSSSRTVLYDISRNWRNLLDATDFPSDNQPDWNEKEEAAAEVLVSALTYLRRIGCKNIERLLLDTIERHTRLIE